ncbi:MAG: hypothetical protein CL613_07805 [Aquimarina sp.]|nr:hypothetical protein [Aquimarina sp.]
MRFIFDEAISRYMYFDMAFFMHTIIFKFDNAEFINPKLFNSKLTMHRLQMHMHIRIFALEKIYDELSTI